MYPQQNPSLYVKIRLTEEAREFGLPQYATLGASGMDLRSVETLSLASGQRRVIHTGVYLAIPEGYEGQVRSRSGLAAKRGVMVLNSPGTVDSDYRGEVSVCLINHGAEPFDITKGDRIAQIVFTPVIQATLLVGEELGDTDRGEGGYGSTGVK